MTVNVFLIYVLSLLLFHYVHFYCDARPPVRGATETNFTRILKLYIYSYRSRCGQPINVY